MQRCVGALLIDGGNLLLGRRSPGRTLFPSLWDVFGGHVEPHEQPEEALIRELKEEIGIEPTEWAYLDTIEAVFGDVVLECAFFVVTRWRGVPANRQPEEHSEIQWFPVESAVRLHLAHPAYPALFARSLVLCKRNQPDAEVRFGVAKGEFAVPDSFFEPLPDDLLKAFNGE